MQSSCEKKSDLRNKALFDELSDYLSLKMCDIRKNCRHCPENTSCENIKITEKDYISIYWSELDETVYSSITVQDINSFKTLLNKCENSIGENLFEEEINFENIPIPSQVTNTPPVMELDDLIENSILEDFFNKSASFQAPKSFTKILNKFDDPVDHMIKDNKEENKYVRQKETSVNGYAMPYKDVTNNINEKLYNDIIDFFKLESLADIFHKEVLNSQDTIIYSPDIFDQSSPQNRSYTGNESSISPVSPILVKYSKKSPEIRPSLKNLKSDTINVTSTTKCSMKTKISSTPQLKYENQLNNKQILEDFSVKKISKALELKDLCDMTTFGLDVGNTAEKEISIPQVKTLCTNSSSSIFDIIRVSNINTQIVNSQEENVIKVNINQMNATSNHEKMAYENNECVSSLQADPQNSATKNVSPEMKITQMISCINKPSQKLPSVQNSCNEKGNDYSDDEDFNLSFYEKKSPNKKRKHDKSYIKTPQKKSTTQTTTPKRNSSPLIPSRKYLFNSKFENMSDDDFEPKLNHAPIEKNRILNKKKSTKMKKVIMI